jgi:hypothetical protein
MQVNDCQHGISGELLENSQQQSLSDRVRVTSKLSMTKYLGWYPPLWIILGWGA